MLVDRRYTKYFHCLFCAIIFALFSYSVAWCMVGPIARWLPLWPSYSVTSLLLGHALFHNDNRHGSVWSSARVCCCALFVHSERNSKFKTRMIQHNDDHTIGSKTRSTLLSSATTRLQAVPNNNNNQHEKQPMLIESTMTEQDDGASCLDETVPPVMRSIHVVILVHGLMGNTKEMSYLEQTIRAQVDKDFTSLFNNDQERYNSGCSNHETTWVLHSAIANEGKTGDGIVAGGHRLAVEIRQLIESIFVKTQHTMDDATDQQKINTNRITLSIVGNSMGGLYARYALSELQDLWNPPETQENSTDYPVPPRIIVQPKVFCTTATPHLGVKRNTYLPLPGAAEYVVANLLQQTGRDLFGVGSDIVHRLSTDKQRFLQPLSQFEQRIAYANVYGTDFQVPTRTAAFLSPTNSIHQRIQIPTPLSAEEKNMIPLVVQTPRQLDVSFQGKDDNNNEEKSNSSQSTDLNPAQRLDALGWIKVFCDVRHHLPSLPIVMPHWTTPTSDPTTAFHLDKDSYTSAELLKHWSSWNRQRWYIPIAHTMIVANSKNDGFAKWNAPGRPLMDRLAADLIHAIIRNDDADMNDSN